MDLIYEMAFYEGERYSGSLLRSHLPAQQSSGLQFGELLTKIPPEAKQLWERDKKGVEVFTQNGCWIITLSFAQFWMPGLLNGILSRQLWVIHNGEIWNEDTQDLQNGDSIRIMGPTPPGLPTQALSAYNYSPKRFGRVCWTDWTTGRIPKEEAITSREAQRRLEELELKIALKKVRVSRNYQPWKVEVIGDESKWDIFPERLEGAPKKSPLPSPRPPPFITREKTRIFLNRRTPDIFESKNPGYF
jgi:hypothetical protein